MKKAPAAHAVLTIHDAAKLGYDKRRSVSRWLKRMAVMLMKDGTKLSSRFTARYMKATDVQHP